MSVAPAIWDNVVRHRSDRVTIASLVRAALRRVLEEDWIVVLAGGIALGYTVLRLAEAIGSSVITALESQSSEQLFASNQGPLTLTVDDRAIVLGPIVQSAIALLVVLALLAVVVGRLPPRVQSPSD